MPRMASMDTSSQKERMRAMTENPVRETESRDQGVGHDRPGIRSLRTSMGEKSQKERQGRNRRISWRKHRLNNGSLVSQEIVRFC